MTGFMRIHRYLLLIYVIMTISCKRHLSRAAVRDNLEKSMSDYLRAEQGADSTRMRFRMLDVSYYEERDYYDCEFTVQLLREGGRDTTGIIKATVSKDFSKVTKKW